MSAFQAAPVHLVGSFPAPDATTAFSKCAIALKGRLKTIPDGEPGWRWNFTIGLVQKKATENPAIGRIWREYDEKYDPLPVKEMSAEDVEQLHEAIKSTSWKLGYAEDAVESYKVFCKLRQEGTIEKHVRFQVCLPGVSSMAIFVKPAFQYLVEDLTYQAMLQETEAITRAIPTEDLAIQFDIASDYIKNEAQQDPSSYLGVLREDFHPPQEDAMERYSGQYAGLMEKVPAEAYTGLHICMGNINNKPVLAPRDMSVMVALANRIISKAKASRQVQWIHFGCLAEWKDPTPYGALSKLEDKNVAVYLGLVYPDDLKGSKERVAAARKHLGKFGVAPVCGLARTSEDGVQSVLNILKDLTPEAVVG
ncbi:uncharacterized protein Z520_00708 [Fonsecaea multimorphosa CBS 102226]|uniref:Cobalamin-independent methionine synthase MetE C-terminal/archaeal domain-containing protein n=1 Tax=Fonsecaea multimorphosa CBS 102226 TaxID=1442371 RepID=A0A0D2HQ58_9EURO|nr:uncharacterized protein Z520_00708 [Fonsecaea multimorphosa CBS 102226]KIY04016.1 hypothetical protein Z520_00708 [Fonsecaea multimorphosa CBS 102226]OAL31852.1 hypothetical protein AYO22_00722 [Fonsecaea multimorphosa]